MTSPLNILFVTPRYRPAVGGAEFHLEAIATHLATRGHTVTVATTTALDVTALWSRQGHVLAAGRETVDGVTINRYPVQPLTGGDVSYRALRRAIQLMIAPRLPKWAIILAETAPSAPALTRWLDTVDQHFDAIIGFNIAYEGLLQAAQRTATRLGCPFVVFPLTHLGAGRRPGADPIARFYTMGHQRRLVGNSDLLVAQTPTEAAFYQQQRPAPRQTLVVGPGVDQGAVLGGDATAALARWGIDGPLVLALGAASRDKGTIDTVRAAQKLWQKGLVFDLVVAGAEAADFAAFITQNKLNKKWDRLHLLGPVTQQEKRDLLAACAMLVMPSRVDSFGVVYLEAWLYGRPVIGAHAWGIDDLIKDGENGLLVPFGRPAALAQAIQALLEDSKLAAQLGQAGRALALEKHLWPGKLAVIEAAVEQLAARTAALTGANSSTGEAG